MFQIVTSFNSVSCFIRNQIAFKLLKFWFVSKRWTLTSFILFIIFTLTFYSEVLSILALVHNLLLCNFKFSYFRITFFPFNLNGNPSTISIFILLILVIIRPNIDFCIIYLCSNIHLLLMFIIPLYFLLLIVFRMNALFICHWVGF